MIDPAELFDILITRALNDVDVDLETFLRRAEALGMDPDAMERQLSETAFTQSGGIFGRFTSNFAGAAEGTAMSAYRIGALAGEFSKDAELLKRYNLTPEEVAEIINSGDTEAVTDLVRDIAEGENLTWVAELLNTCHRCLPLHGVQMTAEQWAATGFDPATIHEGWNSVCHCILVRSALVTDRPALLAPLQRFPTEEARARGVKRIRKTARGVAQKDIDKAILAVEQASDTEEGRKVLRLLGRARSAEFVDDPFASQFSNNQ